MCCAAVVCNHMRRALHGGDGQETFEFCGLRLVRDGLSGAASRMLGDPLPERVAGIDLVDQLVRSDTGFSVAILGGSSDAAAKLADVASEHNRVALVDELAPGWDRPERRSELASRLEA